MSVIWTDIETTGLSEQSGEILEVALVVTDDDLNEVAFKEIVVWPEEDISALMDPFVLEMHTKNGLLYAIEHKCDNAVRKTGAERALIEWLFSFNPVKFYRDIPLAGSTVGFDRRWLRHHMPRLEAMFSHRSIDVSSITELAKRWAPAVYEGRPKSTDTHRALADARGSIEVLRYYREKGFVVGMMLPSPTEMTANAERNVP